MATGRGNENFGAVRDSVGAVLVQCVRDVYTPHPKKDEGVRKASPLLTLLTDGSLILQRFRIVGLTTMFYLIDTHR